MALTQQLKDDVNLAFNFYGVDREEAKFEIERIKNNIYEASKCYSIIAAGIRGLEKHEKI
jgi:hypothetical protein